MERWQQQLQEILNEKKVVAEEAGSIPSHPSEQRPGFSFVFGPGAAITITSIEICVLRPGQLEGEPERGSGTCLLMDAQHLPADVQRISADVAWVEEGIWIESCEPYVMRAINRCCALWYAPSGTRGILAVLPSYKMLDFYDLLVYEYAHRYCPARSRNRNQHARPSGKKAFTLGRSTFSGKHVCGALVLRQKLYRGMLHCRGASFAFHCRERSLVFRTLSGLPVTHCPTCGTELNGNNTCGVSWEEWSAGS